MDSPLSTDGMFDEMDELVDRLLSDERHMVHIVRPTPNARFWVWERGGWVKITLRPGQSLSILREGEGYWSYRCESTRWIHNGNHVSQEYSVFSTRHGNYECRGYESASICPLSSLRSPVRVAEVPSYVTDLPEWGSREQWEACIAG